MPRTASPVPGPLAKAAERFDRWREERSARRITEELWSVAATLAGRYGVNRTARALRLHYPDLKKRLARGAPSSVESGPSPAFVEILRTPTALVASPECSVEFEGRFGAKLRIQVRGASALDLTGLSRFFLERRL